MAKYTLPVEYNNLEWWEKKEVREQYIAQQKGLCWYCNSPLSEKPPSSITKKRIYWGAFPPKFLKHPIHLQHDHNTGLTEGAVHAYCNAILWQYEGK